MTENGLRAMNIARINPDSAKEEQTQRDIIKNLTRNRIHIESTQETHIRNGRDYLPDNYDPPQQPPPRSKEWNSTGRNSSRDTWGSGEIHYADYQA